MTDPFGPGPDDGRWAALNGLRLVGLDVEDARARVEAAGGTFRATTRDGAVTLDLRPDRVTVVVEDGRVVESWGRG